MAGMGAAAAGVALPSASLVAQPATASPRRIDVHHHCYPKTWFERHKSLLLGSDSNPDEIKDWNPRKNIEAMDKNGVATAIVSLGSPAVRANSIEEGRSLTRGVTEAMAQMVLDFPGRFGAFAPLPLTDVEGSLKEIEYIYDVLKLDGIGLLTSYGDKWPGDPAFAPVFEELNRRKAVIFFHPTAPACCNRLMPGIPATAAEYPFDEVRCIMSLLFSGTFTKNSDTRFIFSHAGGPAPILAVRLEQQMRHPNIRERIPNGVQHELKKLYYEVANSTVSLPAMAALLSLASPSQMLFGSDWPYVEIEKTIGGFDQLLYSPAMLRAIDRDNAAKLFPRFQS